MRVLICILALLLTTSCATAVDLTRGRTAVGDIKNTATGLWISDPSGRVLIGLGTYRTEFLGVLADPDLELGMTVTLEDRHDVRGSAASGDVGNESMVTVDIYPVEAGPVAKPFLGTVDITPAGDVVVVPPAGDTPEGDVID